MNYEEVIDTASAKERFMGNYGLFSKFLYQFPERSMFGQLEEQVARGDAKEAFETAHAMKGVVGNLSLKRVSYTLNPVVETLRAGNLPDTSEWMPFAAAYKEAVDAVAELKNGNTPLF